MNFISVLKGPAGSGRRAELYRRALESARAGRETILIVPEQATFEAERILSRAAGGFIGLQVLSLKRLTERVLEETGRRRPVLSEQGVAMTARRVAEQERAELKVYGNAAGKKGFCTELAGLFTQFRRAMITPEELERKTEDLQGSPLMHEKLADIIRIYRGTDEWLGEKYMTEDDSAAEAVRLLPYSFVKDAEIFIDFDGGPYCSGQFLALFGAVTACAGGLTVSVSIDPENEDEPLFTPAKQLLDRMREIAARYGISWKEKEFRDSGERPAALKYVADSVFRLPGKPFEGDVSPVGIFSLPDRASEAEFAADRILELARGGMRWREMAVLVSDASVYAPLIRRSFGLRGIPVFVDEKRRLLNFTAADTAAAALRCVAENYRTGEMLRLAKTGFAGVGEQGASALENYCLRYGIRSCKAPFTRGTVLLEGMREKEFELEQVRIEEAEQARQTLIGPLEELREGLHGRTAGEKLRAVYAYLDRIGLAAALEETAERLVSENRPREAQEHGTIWHALTETFDMMYEILGDVPVSREDFLSVFEEGLSSELARVVPDTADRVLAGEASHTVLDGVKALFILGANEGMLPKDRHDDGLLSDGERRLMKDCGIDLENDSTVFTAALDRYGVYLAAAGAKEKLTFTFSLSDGGSEALPAAFLKQLTETMPGLGFELGDAKTDPGSERLGFRLLTELLREGGDLPLADELMAYYAQRPEYAAHAQAAERLAKGNISSDPLGRELAGELYHIGRPMSASRLEQYNKCPFRQFAQSGLRAEERRELAMRASDTGTLFHAAAEEFIKKCIEREVDFASLDDEGAAAIVAEIMPKVLRNQHDGLLLTDERMHAALFLTIETVRTAVQAIARHMRAGSYRPLAAEARFGKGGLFAPIALDLGEGRTMLLEGIIDRVDTAEKDGTVYFRIVDYKTFGRDMDYSKIYAGETLQLPLYSLAAAQSGEMEPGGMYYMKVLSKPVGENEDFEELFKELRLEGVTPNDDEALFAAEAVREGRYSKILKSVEYVSAGPKGPLSGPGGMRRLLDYAKEKAEKTAAEMFEGAIGIVPAEKACEYCPYKALCGFEEKLPGCKKKHKVKFDRDSFFDRLAELEGEEDGNGGI